MNISLRYINILFSTSVLYSILINNIASDIVVIKSYNTYAISLFSFIAFHRILSQIKSSSDNPKISVIHERRFHSNKLRTTTIYFSPKRSHSIQALYPIIILLKNKNKKKQTPLILNIK